MLNIHWLGIRQEANSGLCGGKIVEEVKERKICLETHTIAIKLGN